MAGVSCTQRSTLAASSDAPSTSVRTRARSGGLSAGSSPATGSSWTARCSCARKRGRGPAMVKRVGSFALYQPLFMALLTGLFVAAGVVAFSSLPIEAFPDVTDVMVTVVTLVPGHAAEEVEKQVTIPLEIAVAGVPHSVRMFS